MNWDERFAGEEYLFGTAPARFLEKQVHRLPPGSEVLVVADGEGRNSVWLAELGHTVNAWDSSAVAIKKARRVARTRDVDVTFSIQNAAEYPWPKARFDAVIGIFIQFAPPKLRDEILAGMMRAARPGGLVMLHGYTVEQLKYGTGGPSVAENLYTEAFLRNRFAGTDIVYIESYEENLSEGTAHVGRSALIDLVARVRVQGEETQPYEPRRAVALPTSAV
ncbi:MULTISPECIES: class I SAM-dependent methyltransferase [unclassified Paracoccus (in: a-proteobacteria)]|uniref:class I SAM-dependent methyltransferase n=1 Tax=unclassified Paracoccus (in: a-proteobacteria) TaxID=2688777 RepID=UPI001F1670D8|nr:MULTISPECIES: class I SAM-dependent methyltransferase [unclassified Paracoccus (in: a-proteobacteria)]QXO85709.1 class I SAM-dependent methyltransferase [Paracoccus sp. (in: a-proteobacteria)]